MIGFDLLTASIGLAVTALAAALLLPLWRRAPVPAYRLAVSVLAAALALPLLQAGARALDLPVPHPVRDLARSLAAPATELEPPAAEPLELWLTPEEAEDLVLDEVLLASVDPSVLPAPPADVAPPAVEPTPAIASLPWGRIALGLWAAGALWALGRTLLRLRATRRLFADAEPVTDPAVLAVWDAVRADSRVGARTGLFQSPEVRTPACSGLARPAVVLPAEAGLERRPDLLACVLTHELVHLERRDPWVLVGEELLRATFWFHPAAWWLVARLAALRELSCDCLVVRRTGKRKRYASALVEYASWMQRPAPHATWAAVVPWSESRGHLTRRIEMLLQPQDSARTGRVVAPAAVGVLMTFLWSGQLALATSSCAGTRSETAHEHPHEHADADGYTVHASHDGKEHDVKVLRVDGKKVVIETKGGDGEPVVWRSHGDGHDGKTVESHVVVVKKGDGEQTVYTGEDAKKWLAENEVGVEVHALDGTHGEHDVVKEIKQAWRQAEGGGEHEVIVIGGADAKAKAKAKSKAKADVWSWTTAAGKGDHHDGDVDVDVEVIVSGIHGQHAKEGKVRSSWSHEGQSDGGQKRVRVLLHDGEGKEHWLEVGGENKELIFDGKRLELGDEGGLRFSKKGNVWVGKHDQHDGEGNVFFRKRDEHHAKDNVWFGKHDGEGNVFFGEHDATKYKELRERVIELHDGKKAKVLLEVHGEEGEPHGLYSKRGEHGQHDYTELPTLENVFKRKKQSEAELEELRRELEKTRAALEKQRKMLEELKQQLHKQKVKSDVEKDWTR